MTSRTEPPFRADHVGSLLRPPALLAARAAQAAGEIDIIALRAAEDEAIRDVVAMQERVGLQLDDTMTELARSPFNTARSGTDPTSVSEEGV